MVKTLLAALFSAAIITVVPQSTPVKLNNVNGPTKVKALKAELPEKEQQAKAEEKAVLDTQPTQPEQATVVTPEPVVVETPQIETPAPVPTGSHEQIMAAAGIAPSDYSAVDYIVSHESTWNASAVNASSGSCGLVQELPCGKSGCTFGDGVCQLRWATSYATGRYGSWWGAYSFWSGNRWW